MNEKLEWYKKGSEALALAGLALSSFSFMASRPTSVVGKVQARLQYSREVYAHLRRALRVSLEKEVSNGLVSRATQTMPAIYRDLQAKWLAAERTRQDSKQIFDMLGRAESNARETDRQWSWEGDSKLKNLQRDTLNEDYRNRLAHPGYDVLLKEDHLLSDRETAANDVAYIPTTLADRLREIAPNSDNEADESNDAEAHDELGTGLLNSVFDTMFSSVGLKDLLNTVGLPPFMVEMLEGPKNEAIHALAGAVWSAADSIAKQQLERSPPDLKNSIAQSARTIVAKAAIQWNKLTEGSSQSLVDDADKSLQAAKEEKQTEVQRLQSLSEHLKTEKNSLAEALRRANKTLVSAKEKALVFGLQPDDARELDRAIAESTVDISKSQHINASGDTNADNTDTNPLNIHLATAPKPVNLADDFRDQMQIVFDSKSVGAMKESAQHVISAIRSLSVSPVREVVSALEDGFGKDYVEAQASKQRAIERAREIKAAQERAIKERDFRERVK